MSDRQLSGQTLSYLSSKFREVGIRPKTKYGQNFLIDLNLLRLLFSSAQVGPDDVVLEIGGGTGSLTTMLAGKAAHVISVEIDDQLYQLAQESLANHNNVTLVRQDALKNKNRVSPSILEQVRSHLEGHPERKFKLVSNLPYNVATPIISNLLTQEPLPHLMVVTIQRELGERMIAKPSTKDYSALSIWMQCQTEVEIVRILPPSAFWPQPKVESAIVRITLDPEKRAAIPDLANFHEFVRSMFFHRRKFLRNELLSLYKKKMSKDDVDDILTTLEHPATVRAEELTIEQMLDLYQVAEAKADQLANSQG
ncbi:Ribosomal RNA small subunit methyltransferase A [Planctomycetales bacterium 10988]|nr:Ribosomal RNA small subunit methyltransferase A [Planctomycetales bacterium 10988]